MRAVSHLPVKLILACLLAVAMLATLTPLPLWANEAVTVQIASGRTGDRAIRHPREDLTSRVAVSGAHAPANATISASRLVALDAAGNAVGEQPILTRNDRNPAETDDYLYVDGNGNIQGAITAGCQFFGSREIGCPGDPVVPVRGVRLEMTVGDVPVASNMFPVDYSRPYVRRYELIASDQIRVVFSEPVRTDATEALQRNAWTVEGSPSVVRVAQPDVSDCEFSGTTATGCTRILTLGTHLAQDATPRVTFQPAALVDPYEDYASNQLLFDTQFNADNRADSNANDLIRPVTPHIQSVDGKTGGAGSSIISNTPSPEARLTNLTGGHVAELTVQRPSGTSVVLTERVPAGATSLDMTIPAATDGKYTLSAVAIDTNGNRSDDATKNPPALAEDGARPSVAYVLDTVAPQVLTADLKDRRTVALRFTEAVLPDGDAGDWFVGDVPVTAVGSGSTRTLNSSIDLTKPGAVRWQPTSTQPGSVGRYGDQAGNGMAAVSGITLADLPPIQAPAVTSPSRVTYTKTSGIRIAGTAPTRSGLAIDLYDRGDTKVLRSSAVSDGRWSIDQALGADGRYSYAVQLRDTQTGAVSPRVPVADVVRDTVAPRVTVRAPAEAGGIGGVFTTPEEYGVGDAVTVRWTATDSANDPVRPDHGRQATIFLVDEESGSRRAVRTGIQHQAGQEQSASYTLKAADLAGQGLRDLHFDVAVSDLAGNVGQTASGTIRLLDTLIGYRAVLTSLAVGGSSVIEARFPVALQGSTIPADWLVDGQAPLTAQKSSTGRVVTLTVPMSDDPNAPHTVAYQPSVLNADPLEGADDRQVTTSPRRTIDRIVPVLSTRRPQTARVVDRSRVLFSGTTDETARSTRNTIAAYPADRTGARVGPAIATKRAAADGTWSMWVPLNPNRRNRIVVQAIDPSGNRSHTSALYSVIEDSKRPVVRILSPDDGDTLRFEKRLTWRTYEANKRSVAIFFKKRSASRWQAITTRTADDGVYQWTLPRRALRGAIFDLRIRSTDDTGKRGYATVRGLRANFSR